MSLLRRVASATALLAAMGGCGGERPRPDLDAFDEVARRATDRARTAVELAASLQDPAVIPSPAPGPTDVRTIRFAERLGDVVHATSSAGVRADEDAIVRGWQSSAGIARVIDPKDPLEIELDPIPTQSVGAVVIRAAADGAARLHIEVGGMAVRLDLVADGESREYLVDLRAAIDQRGGAAVDRCVVRLESGDAAALWSLDLLDRSWKYRAPWGRASERIGHVTRSGVYFRGEGRLEFPLDGQWRDARMSFGLVEVVPGRRARVRIELRSTDGDRPIADVEIAGGDPWVDLAAELGDLDLDGATLSVSVERLDGSGLDGVVVWASPVLWEPPERRLNVLVLLEDALRADRLSIYGHDRATSPFKERFFADGVRFERCISQATKTRFSCPSFMTSLRPMATGVYGVWNHNPRLGENYLTLAEIFRHRGWATASFLQNANAGPDNGLDQGFDRVVENIPGRADNVYGGPVFDWLAGNRDRNLFGYLHVADPHQPYQPPPATRGWYDEILAASGEPRWSDALWLQRVRRALYDGEVANNDAALPLLIDHLASLGTLDDTVVVLISDHGEHLGEHGLWDHVPPSYMQVIHVPMLIRLPPASARPSVVDQPVQLLDLMPTLLELAGIDASDLPMHGRSLVPFFDGRGEHVPSNVAVVQEAMSYHRPDDPKNDGSLVWDRWHYLDSGKAPSVLFDHRSDLAETHPIRPSRSLENRARALFANLRQLDDELRRRLTAESSSTIEVDAANIANLEALGYLDDAAASGPSEAPRGDR